jgi:uncharacterized repeat protein (TIGR01451 family)/uncharacterized delta-60 repeat protein
MFLAQPMLTVGIESAASLFRRAVSCARQFGSVITLAAVLFVSATLAPAARGQNAGSLDTTFNSPNGFVAVDVSGSGKGSDAAATAIDSKGRIVVVGITSDTWSLVRYNKDGTPDSTFGSDGKVVTTIAGAPTAAAIDGNDNILVAGVTNNTTTFKEDFTVAKFLAADGSLDVLNYGKAGLAVLDVATVSLNALSIGIDSAGGTIVAGFASNSATSGEVALARFDKTGNLDMSFGNQSPTSGYSLLQFGTTPAIDEARALAIGPVSGRIVVAGLSNSSGSEDFALARFMSNGTLDISFGASSVVPGTVLTDFSNAGSDEFASAVALTEDTSGVMTIVAAGQSDAAGANEFALARYLEDGSLDTTFGIDNSGKVITSFASVVTGAAAGTEQDAALAVAIDSQRRVVTSGLISYEFLNVHATFADLGLARYNTTGTLDTSFGSGGLDDQFVSKLNPNSNHVALALDGDGNLVTASTKAPDMGDQDDFLIARFLGQAPTADLQLTKQVFPATAKPGHTVIYTISVTNAGPNPAQGVIITDILPAGVTFSSCTPPTGSTCSGLANNVVVTFTSPLAVSTTPATIAIDATVNSGTAGQTISNTASVTSTTMNTGNASASASFQVPSADLAITDQVSPSVVVPGGLVTYTLTVTNNGPSDATGGVAVSDTLPSQVTFMSCSATASGVCGGSGNVTFPSLKNGASATITLTGTLNNGVANGTSVSDTASVASTDGIPDPNPTNNTSAPATFVVLNQADLAVSLSVAKGSGRQQIYTVSVKNNGPFAAAQLVLSDTIPTGTTFASIAPGAWSCSTPAAGGKGTVSCTLSGLAPNVTTSFKFVVNATVSGSASITDKATVSAATFDPNSANNSATLTSKAN